MLIYYLLSIIYNFLSIKLNKNYHFDFYVFNTKVRIILFIFDLLINYFIGTFLMLPYFQGTLFAAFFKKCPIALSPFILVAELLLILFYSL